MHEMEFVRSTRDTGGNNWACPVTHCRERQYAEVAPTCPKHHHRMVPTNRGRR